MLSIPKKIHYVWLGDKVFGQKENFCMKSWQKILTDYEFILWDNHAVKNFDNRYFREAMATRQYAFASDYVRLKALEEQGGIYLDTDEEILKSLNPFLEHDFFMGCQSCGSAKGLNPALVGVKAHHPIIKDLLKIYDDLAFINSDGSYNLKTNPAYFAKVLTEKYRLPTTYLKKGRIEFYPNAYLYDYFYFGKKSRKSYATHHYAGSWRPDWEIKDKASFKFWGNQYIIRKYKKRNDNAISYSAQENIVFRVKTSRRSHLALVKI